MSLPRPARAPRLTRAASFTLVELLAVVSIVAIITIMAIPAMKALQSTALATASRQVANELQLARQYAITRRVPVRFCLGVDLSSGASKMATNLVCRGYMIAEAFRDANGTTLWWVPIQDWRVLPDGVVFSEHNATSYQPMNLDTVPDTLASRTLGTGSPGWRYFNNNATMTFTNLSAATGLTNWIVSFVEFKPSGSANNVNGFGGIRLVQGALGDNISSREIVVADRNNWAFIEYNEIHGRVRVRTPETYRP